MYLKKLVLVLLLSVLCDGIYAQTYFRTYSGGDDTIYRNRTEIYNYSPGHGALILNHAPTGTSTNIQFIKLNSIGDTVWTKRNFLDTTFVYNRPLPDTGGTIMHVFDTIHFTDLRESLTRLNGSGNYLLAAIDMRKFGILLKQFDSMGNLVSSCFFQDSNTLALNYPCVKVTACGADSFYILYGTDSMVHFGDSCTYDTISHRSFVQKMTSNYTTLWKRRFDRNYVEPGTCYIPSPMITAAVDFDNAITTADGGIAFSIMYDSTPVSGYYGTIPVYYRYFLRKLKPDGSLDWQQEYQSALHLPSSGLQMPQHMFATHDSCVVALFYTQDSASYIYRMAKFGPTGSLLDSITFPHFNSTPFYGIELLNHNFLFSSWRVPDAPEFFVYNSHLNFLYGVPCPFIENSFCFSDEYDGNFGGPLIANEFGGAFCAFTGGSAITRSSWHTTAVNFDSSFNCYPSFVSGTISQDDNHNCIYDGTDLRIPYVAAVAHETSSGADYYGYANDTGYYAINLPFGNYNISHPYLGYERNECGAYSYAITSAATFPNSDFCDTLLPGINDLQLSLYSYCLVPGDTTMLIANAYNNGSVTVDTFMSVILDARSTFLSSVPAPVSVSGDTLRYHLHLLSDSFMSVQMQLRVSTTATIGDTFVFQANSPFPDNIVPSNDSAYYARAIVSSYDPNFKAVNQRFLFHRNNTLIYTVGFQNTGTYPAKNVVVLDTLDGNIDPASFKLLSSTHGMPQVKWLNDHRLLFIFNNIHLPDSMTNPAGSHGEFSYSVKARATAMLGDTVKNTAYIYFDYNEPIVTNTTKNVLAPPSVVNSIAQTVRRTDFEIYPNPSTGAFTIRIPAGSTDYDATITDITGKVAKVFRLTSPVTQLNPNLQPGLYFIKLTNNTTAESCTKKLIVTD